MKPLSVLAGYSMDQNFMVTFVKKKETLFLTNLEPAVEEQQSSL